MAFDQESLNKNLVNGLSVMNKALMSVIYRQKLIFDGFQDKKQSDLCLFDMNVLEDMQKVLERMKALV